MVINILTNIESHFCNYLTELKNNLLALNHKVNCINNPEDIINGDIMFVLSYYKIIKKQYFAMNKNNIIIHESNLPEGKGWSPLSWQILEGKNNIIFSLFEMDEKVDNGIIYMQDTLQFNGHELCEEIRQMQARKKIQMCLEFLNNYPNIVLNGKQQCGEKTFYPKRGLESSRLDPNKTIAEQFNLLRIVDNNQYPAFFEYNGHKYKIYITKYESDTNSNQN